MVWDITLPVLVFSHSFLNFFKVNHGYDEEKETSDSSKLRILKQKVEGLEINCDSYEPGRNEVLVCPKVSCLISLRGSF